MKQKTNSKRPDNIEKLRRLIQVYRNTSKDTRHLDEEKNMSLDDCINIDIENTLSQVDMDLILKQEKALF